MAAPPAGVQARLGELTRAVLPLTLAGGGAVVGLSLLWRRPLKEAVKAGVAVAVAAVPEGLPLVATVAQQAAARRLSRRGAVVRNARVLEALGRVDTVCFDKTGTLTENRLRVVRLVPLDAGGCRRPAGARPRSPVTRPTRTSTRSTGRSRPPRATTRVRRAACRSPPGAGSPRACAPAGWW